MKHFIVVFFIVAPFLTVLAQALQPLAPALMALQPENVFTLTADKPYRFSDQNKETAPAAFKVAKDTGGITVITAELLSAAKSHYDVQSSWKSERLVEKGDVLLARFAIRSLYARQESGEAVVYFYLQQVEAPNEKSVITDITAGSEWKIIEIPFTAANTLKSGEASIVFSYGILSQKVEIASLQVLNFKQHATLEQLPVTRFTYAGREAGAAWRKEALQRIEKIRTAPLQIILKDAKGTPVKGARVTAKLVDPDFIFGTAVSVNLINGTDSNATVYKYHLHELFNAVTIDNNLKWPAWMDPQKREATKIAVQWILDNGFRLRGHNLVWPGKKFTPSLFAQQVDFGPGFADSIAHHIDEIVSYAKGKVYGWDVINELLHEKDYFKVMPRSNAGEWFKLAKKNDPNAVLFINEYGMLNNLASPQVIREYLDVILELQNGGAPVEAIGVQGHIGRQPRNPVQVLTDLDMFTTARLPVQITEFDINTPDETLQADYTRDFLIACYSHPLVDGFTMWGFWQTAHWKPAAAMYKSDWTPKPNLAVWKELVLHQWRTTINEKVNAAGTINTRGHLGRYEITVTKKGVTKKVSYQLTKNALPATIQL